MEYTDKELNKLLNGLSSHSDKMFDESDKFMAQEEKEEWIAHTEEIILRNKMINGFPIRGINDYAKGLYVLYGYDPNTEHPFAENGYYPLYVGESGQMGIRLKQHVKNTSHYKHRIAKIKVIPFQGNEGDGRRVRQLYEKALIDILRPELNIKSTVNRIFGEAIDYIKHEGY